MAWESMVSATGRVDSEPVPKRQSCGEHCSCKRGTMQLNCCVMAWPVLPGVAKSHIQRRAGSGAGENGHGCFFGFLEMRVDCMAHTLGAFQCRGSNTIGICSAVHDKC